MELLSKVLQAVLEAALPIFAAALAGWMIGKMAEVFQRLKAKNPDWFYFVKSISETAVDAAEQLYQNGHGAEKKQYALEAVEAYLAERGLNLDLKIIDAEIESAVKSLKQRGLEAPEAEA